MSDYNPALDEVQEVTEDRGVPCEDYSLQAYTNGVICSYAYEALFSL